jgi:hypothetical protein
VYIVGRLFFRHNGLDSSLFQHAKGAHGLLLGDAAVEKFVTSVAELLGFDTLEIDGGRCSNRFSSLEGLTGVNKIVLNNFLKLTDFSPLASLYSVTLMFCIFIPSVSCLGNVHTLCFDECVDSPISVD